MKNFRPINAKCCGTCRELDIDDMSGHYYCRCEEGMKYPTVDFDPQEGEQWQYVCDDWGGQIGDKDKREEMIKKAGWKDPLEKGEVIDKQGE